MPGVENWTENPLDFIQNVINRLPEGSNDVTAVEEAFSQRLNEEALSYIPSLNDTALHDVPANSLVRYRCMVQDMFGPELYLARYKVTSVKSGEVAMRSGRYKDVAECGCHEEIHIDAPNNITRERQTLYCVPVPGEAAWVKENYARQSKARTQPSTSSPPTRLKRGLEEENSDKEKTNGAVNSAEMRGPRDPSLVNGSEQNGTASNGNGQQASAANGQTSKLPDLNFPLPGETGPACLVKMYKEEEEGQLKVNDIVEVVGILSVDPSLAQFPQGEEETMEMSTPAERAAHAPPPSLVPRLHAVLTRKVTHNNPLLGRDVDGEPAKLIRNEAQQLRKDLMAVLQEALCGDSLAAEYLLCHLVSHVYARADVMPLGKLGMNLSGRLAASGLAPLLYQLIASLTTQSHFLPLSLSNMNTLTLTPRKDYDANRLCTGQLQLADNTHLVLDETALDAGRLDPQGVRNVTALGDVIQWQKVTYDFKFHTQDFPTNLPVLVVSEGESFLPKDVHIPLKPSSVPADLEQHYRQIDARLTPELLNRFRAFLSLCRSTVYEIAEDIQQALQEEFVASRKENPSSMSVNDFHRLLSLVRMLTLSQCQSQCSSEILTRALDMEKELRSRLPASSSR